MGRPPIKLSEDQTREVETLAALLTQEQIADYLGIARNTFRAICDRDAKVSARYKRGKARAIAHVANGLLTKARAGDTTSAIFYLKTQAGWREKAEVEHTGTVETTGAAERLRLLIERKAAQYHGEALLAPDDRLMTVPHLPEPGHAR
jgi:DNA-binding XRE family transcriptional regulator